MQIPGNRSRTETLLKEFGVLIGVRMLLVKLLTAAGNIYSANCHIVFGDITTDLFDGYYNLIIKVIVDVIKFSHVLQYSESSVKGMEFVDVNSNIEVE